ncbi:hypothetical protein M422DRAFT_251579 [Sphaerobolus stellatus SS14]|uniref:Retrotransposon gag domain-containing protein n=1 Tax=Sphaerobolus stellatus (strain SS14) TaxID=990650 RepID=A0A0C9W0L1_SPHS4|nr:hypothetical protein M422DRAFT_251579 [Sphaerobolus stellatus SS14]
MQSPTVSSISNLSNLPIEDTTTTATTIPMMTSSITCPAFHRDGREREDSRSWFKTFQRATVEWDDAKELKNFKLYLVDYAERWWEDSKTEACKTSWAAILEAFLKRFLSITDTQESKSIGFERLTACMLMEDELGKSTWNDNRKKDKPEHVAHTSGSKIICQPLHPVTTVNTLQHYTSNTAEPCPEQPMPAGLQTPMNHFNHFRQTQQTDNMLPFSRRDAPVTPCNNSKINLGPFPETQEGWQSDAAVIASWHEKWGTGMDPSPERLYLLSPGTSPKWGQCTNPPHSVNDNSCSHPQVNAVDTQF